ncbi:12744_t:CDS:2 [Dentiscutata erythropus]|uniref:12744_t:CDS:1 n=1 Tax=Dentiscutata erythropus TaxID=1348616 RepID=A0A9N9GZN2_9GLOM|nr:12744_t:CDS:2 [Dentiscutata erythropus]
MSNEEIFQNFYSNPFVDYAATFTQDQANANLLDIHNASYMGCFESHAYNHGYPMDYLYKEWSAGFIQDCNDQSNELKWSTGITQEYENKIHTSDKKNENPESLVSRPSWQKYINIGDYFEDDYYGVSCKHCPYNWAHAKLQLLKQHLACKCSNIHRKLKRLIR